MGIELPGWLRTTAKIAVGEEWPEGDETAMRRLADSWHEMAIKIADTSVIGDDAAKATLATVEGAVHDAIAAEWKKLGHEGLTKLQELTDHMQEVLEEGAADIEKAKIDIIAALTILAAQLAVDGALLIFSGGTTAVAAAAEAAATRMTVRMIIRKLIEKLMSEALEKTIAIEAGKNALFNVVKDIGTQFVQVETGRRDSVSFKDFWQKDVAGGLAEGAASGLFGKDGLGEIVGEGSTKATTMVANAGVDAVADTAGKVSEQVVTGEGDKIDWSTFTSGAIGGAAGGAMADRAPDAVLGDASQLQAASTAAATFAATHAGDEDRSNEEDFRQSSLNL